MRSAVQNREPEGGSARRAARSRIECATENARREEECLVRAHREREASRAACAARPYQVRLDPNDSILSLAERLAKYGGGGTDCSLPLRAANTRLQERQFAGAVLVSDNQSWVYRGRAHASGSHGSTGVMTEWQQFMQNQQRVGNAKPKLICIDLQPATTAQAPDRDDILNISGFSDAVFHVVASFLDDDANRFVAGVESIEL